MSVLILTEKELRNIVKIDKASNTELNHHAKAFTKKCEGFCNN